MNDIDWQHHLTEFRASGKSLAEYCTASGVKYATFRYHVYKKKTKPPKSKVFKEFTVTTELVITRDHRGALSLSGFDPGHLPELVGAWSNALSR